MKPSTVIIALAAVAVVVIIFYSVFTGSNEQVYKTTLEKERQAKDEFMRQAEDSPFAEDRTKFSGLQYFPPDPKFRVVANLEAVQNRKVVVLPTSDGKEKRYLEYAYASFMLDGINNKLLILEIIDPGPYKGTLFLGFADRTSAFETYGAGRYLDLKKTPGASSITLDFNNSYNPYCAYSDDFSCPFPPKENVLQVGIMAGEKTYGTH